MKYNARLLVSALVCFPLGAAVNITGITSSPASPQPLGTPITINVTATDTNPGPLTFQFNAAFGTASQSLVRDFNIGIQTNGVWTNQAVPWSTIEGEGQYTLQVVAKDFSSGETATATLPFTFTSVVAGGSLTVVPTANPLVALAAVPPCPAGDWVRVVFTQAGSTASTQTGLQPCHAPASSNFYLGGMYAGTTYNVSYEVQKHVVSTPGPELDATGTGTRFAVAASATTFTTGPLPASLGLLDNYAVQTFVPQADDANVLLNSQFNVPAGAGIQITATDRNGVPVWFYLSDDYSTLLTRGLEGGYFFVLQSGPLWYGNTSTYNQQLRQIDLAGNVIKETNIGVLQQKLSAMGATDFQACGNIPFPVAVGSACLEGFSHDAILLPNGNWAFIVALEKITAPGTQGDTTGLNYDVLGDGIVVLDANLNPIWYWDAFQHDGGGRQLDINRAPPAGDVCTPNAAGCPPMYLFASPGLAPTGSDWMHSNALDYSKADGNFIMSIRAQDWALKIHFSDGAGDGTILWRMGLDGDFTFNNIANDPYPWFSHQHDVGVENNGVMTLFDNGNTRIYTYGGNSRGMALNFDESTMQVTPIFVQDIGYFAPAVGSAQLLTNGDYFYHAGITQDSPDTYSFEYSPVTGAITGTEVYGLQGDVSTYRTFQMFDLYSPPPT